MLTVDAFRDDLLPGEALIWFDRPAQGILIGPRDAVLIPFSLLWGGFAIFWETTAVSSKGPIAFSLFGIPFVILGIFFIFGRFLMDAWLRGMTGYALTDRRILIRRGGPWASFNAISLDRLPEATLNERAHGRGTIRFGPQSLVWGSRSAGFGSWIASLDSTPQLLAIADAKRVFGMIQQRAQRV